jgi:hypothetical protein
MPTAPATSSETQGQAPRHQAQSRNRYTLRGMPEDGTERNPEATSIRWQTATLFPGHSPMLRRMAIQATAGPGRPPGFRVRSGVISVVSPILAVIFVLAVMFSLLQVFLQVMSEPCPHDDSGCGDGRAPFGLYGLAVAVSVALAWVGLRYWWNRWRRLHRFRPAPGWPPPPYPHWVPSAAWRPDPAWPPAPPGWTFWD